MLHGATLNKVKNINEAFRRAGATMLTKVDPPETLRVVELTNTVHSNIFDYSLPSDVKQEKIVDLRPQINRTEADNPTHLFLKPFDLRKARGNFVIRYDDVVKSLRYSKAVKAGKTLHNMNSLTANGTWATTADASNLTADTLNKVKGNASLNFDLTGAATTGYIENSDMTAVDLSAEENIAKLFVYVYIPDTTIITNYILRFGSSSANYWSVTVTSPHDQTTFKTGWNLLSFNWNRATETGTGDSSAINYLRLTVTYDGTADTDLRVDEIVASVGEIYELVYYSNAVFRNSSGTFAATTSSDSDILNLGEDGAQIFTLESLIAIAQQLQGIDSGFDIGFAKNELLPLYQDYQMAHPSQIIKQKDFARRPNLFSGSRSSYLK